MPRGILPVLYSYYRADGALDHDANLRQIDWLLERGADGITLFGLASEGPMLTPDERVAALDRCAARLTPDQQLLVTIQPSDNALAIARAAVERHGSVGLIIQIGRDPAPSLAQVRALAADADLAGRLEIGLQLAPGLIDTDFTCASLAAFPDIIAAVSFLKAEYNSLDLEAHIGAHPRKVDLLVGRHGQNVLEYLEMGATGIIPATDMAPALVRLLARWRAGDRDGAVALYGIAAPFIDFAMQDLDTLVEVGRTIMASHLGFAADRRRGGRTFANIAPAVARWSAFWSANSLDR